ncbi:hypothetical protein VTI28DRAFT_2404 [Corynascus sepedonium]
MSRMLRCDWPPSIVTAGARKLHIGDCSDSTLRSGAGFLLFFLPNKRHAQSRVKAVWTVKDLRAWAPAAPVSICSPTRLPRQLYNKDPPIRIRLYAMGIQHARVLDPPSSYIPPIVVLLQTRATWRVFTTQHTGKVATLSNSSNWSRTPTR